MHKYYIVDYKLEVNDKVVKTYHIESENILEGFKNIKIEAQELGAKIYRNYSMVTTYREEIYDNIFVNSHR